MEELEIAFDTKEKSEYFIKYLPLEYTDNLIRNGRNKYYIFTKQNLVPRNIGIFLLAFFNTDFNNFDNFKKFILEYLFVHLFFKMNPHIQSSTTNPNFKSNKMFEFYKSEGKKVRQNYII